MVSNLGIMVSNLGDLVLKNPDRLLTGQSGLNSAIKIVGSTRFLVGKHLLPHRHIVYIFIKSIVHRCFAFHIDGLCVEINFSIVLLSYYVSMWLCFSIPQEILLNQIVYFTRILITSLMPVPPFLFISSC